MKTENILKFLAPLFALVFVGCSTTTTTTFYREDGKTVDRVVVEQSISDANALADYLRRADDGCATDRALDVTKFTLGYGDVGLAWLSIGGNSTKAPAEPAAAQKVLEAMAKVKSAGKTTIQTASVGVNSQAGASAIPSALPSVND